MKLDRKKMLLISFMLFSLFFGAGNLIFPPFLGQNAAAAPSMPAMLGFLATAVILPVLGVIVVARFDGLEQPRAVTLGRRSALIFTLSSFTCRLSRAWAFRARHPCRLRWRSRRICRRASNIDACGWWCIRWCSFSIALVAVHEHRASSSAASGIFSRRRLLILLVSSLSCELHLFRGTGQHCSAADGLSARAPFLKGFSEGYQTMDTIAALNFGLGDCHDAGQRSGLTKRKDRTASHRVKAGAFARN